MTDLEQVGPVTPPSRAVAPGSSAPLCEESGATCALGLWVCWC